MSDILDQSEVDALIAAVNAGSVSGSTGASAFASRPPPVADVLLYDFKRPERVSKDQMRALEALHEGFGRNLGVSLSGYLRTIIEVTVSFIEQFTYSEFIHSLPNPTCFNLLRADTLDGQVCLEISPLILYPIIDRLLGGSSNDLFIPQRPLTQIEQRLVQGVTTRATQHLSEAWSNLTPIIFKAEDFESNPQLVQIVPPNETVVVIGFELKMGNRAGTMSLCLPYNVIEPVMGRLATQNWVTYHPKGEQETAQRNLAHNMTAAPLELRTLLATTSMRMSELLTLQVGDVITTNKLADTDLLVQVENKNKFYAKPGQHRGFKAVCITRKVRSPEEILAAQVAQARANAKIAAPPALPSAPQAASVSTAPSARKSA